MFPNNSICSVNSSRELGSLLFINDCMFSALSGLCRLGGNQGEIGLVGARVCHNEMYVAEIDLDPHGTLFLPFVKHSVVSTRTSAGSKGLGLLGAGCTVARAPLAMTNATFRNQPSLFAFVVLN